LSKRLSKSTIAIFTIIAIAAVSLSIASDQYSNYSSSEILKISSSEVRSNSQIQAHDLANVLVNKMLGVSNNLQVLSHAPSVKNKDVQNAAVLFTAARQSTGNFSSSYFWVDKDGKLVWADTFSSNSTLAKRYVGDDRSFRDYYSVPKSTLRPYYSTVVDSVDGIPRMYVAYPIISNSQDGKPTFDGVIAAAFNLDTLGKFLQAQLSPGLQSSTGMIDRNGIILYSANETFIGKDIFGNQFQALLPADIKDTFDNVIRESLTGKPGAVDFTYRGNTSTIAYEPVLIQGNDFAILYVVAPHQLAGDVVSLIDQQRNFNIAVIGAVASVAISIAIVVLLWNKGLTKTVQQRTEELRNANESLQDSNKQLASANAQLEVNEKMQREFINIAAHELRTPTQAILGYSELFDMNQEGKEDAIKAIARNANRLERLTNDILDVTRIEGNSLSLSKESFDLSEVILTAIDDAKSQLSNGDINFVFAKPEQAVFVFADKTRINQVISNLLSNAIKFTRHGTITVKLDQSGDTAVISVIDSGSGIHPDMQARLFTKFASKSQTGTGLGLYISKSIIEAHGGMILGGNNKQDSGATFSFTLPLNTADKQSKV
jgi:signal transduction histidine kinase